MNSSMYFHFNSFFIVRATKLILEIIFPSRPHEHMLVKTSKYIITVEKDWGMLKYEKYHLIVLITIFIFQTGTY